MRRRGRLLRRGGDGSLAACPCGNAGSGDTGCDNAQGTGGVAIGVVAQTTSPNGATLVGSGFPVMSSPTAVVLRSNALDAASPVVFGDGAGPGTYYYQLWYRNLPSGFCDAAAAFNLERHAARLAVGQGARVRGVEATIHASRGSAAARWGRVRVWSADPRRCPMLRSLLSAVAGVLFVSVLVAQDRPRSLRPVDSNVHERSVRVDPRTRIGSRVPNRIGNSGLETVYDHTCPAAYFFALNTTSQNGAGSTGPEALGDWGGVPGLSFTGNTSCTPGCADSYQVQEFTIAYCSNDIQPVDMVLHFWDRTATGGSGLDACDGTQLIGGAVPPAVATATSVTLAGLPRSSAANPLYFACYSINVLLDPPGFVLNGGTSFPPFSTMGDRFAWSMQVTNGNGGAGPILTGNASLGSPCTFCTGTVWELGGQTTNPGFGLGQSAQLWLDSYGGSTPTTNNCFSAPGPWPGMSLTVRALEPCGDTSSFCDASDGALVACPCGNPGSPGTGCDNAQATGGVGLAVLAQTTGPNGATLSGTGFSTMGAPTAIVLRSIALDPSSPIVFGDGLRCVATTPLVRLAATTASGGTSVHTFGHSVMAGSGTFYYQLWYRNTPSTFCDASAAFNLSNGVTIDW